MTFTLEIEMLAQKKVAATVGLAGEKMYFQLLQSGKVRVVCTNGDGVLVQYWDAADLVSRLTSIEGRLDPSRAALGFHDGPSGQGIPVAEMLDDPARGVALWLVAELAAAVRS